MDREKILFSWREFKSVEPQNAEAVIDLVWQVCEIDAAKDALESAAFEKLVSLIMENPTALGLPEASRNIELLRWATIVGFDELGRAVRDS